MLLDPSRPRWLQAKGGTGVKTRRAVTSHIHPKEDGENIHVCCAGAVDATLVVSVDSDDGSKGSSAHDALVHRPRRIDVVPSIN